MMKCKGVFKKKKIHEEETLIPSWESVADCVQSEEKDLSADTEGDEKRV